MKTLIPVKIESFENDNKDSRIDKIFENFDLMAENYMDSIETFYIAYIDSEPVGFQAVGFSGKTILIQVKEVCHGQGIGSALVKESGSFEPKQNGCKKFWSKMQKIHG